MARTEFQSSPALEPSPPRFSRIIIATHYWTAGIIWALKKYLLARTEHLLVIAHPLVGRAGPSYAEVYSDGLLTHREERPTSLPPSRYLWELRATTQWSREIGGPAEVFIAGDGLLALAGLWLRRRKLVSSVLQYSVDFVPNRFRNPVVNRLYHLIDRFDVRHVDVVWNVTKEIQMARRRRDGDHPTAPQLVVPVGADFSQIDRRHRQENTSNEIAFVGHLLEKQGVQLAIEAMPKILATIPDARLIIIGDGPYAPTLRDLAARCGVSSAVAFLGPLFDDLEIANRLTRAAVGIAPYVPDPHSFSNFGDPGKIKIYLACGLPVVTTSVPPIATTIDKEGAGTVTDYSVDSYASAVLRYLTTTAAARQAKESALALGARFDWNAIFDTAWRETLPLLGNRRRHWRSH